MTGAGGEAPVWSKPVQIALPVKATSLSLDMREEVIETLLVLLELPPYKMARYHGTIYDECEVTFRKRPATMLRKTEAVIDKLIQVVSLPRSQMRFPPSRAA